MSCSFTRVPYRRSTSPMCLNGAGFDEVYVSQLGADQVRIFRSTRRALVPRLSA